MKIINLKHKITCKHKFYGSAVILAASVITTLPHFVEITENLITYGFTFSLFCAPAFLLFTKKMRQLHNIEQKLPALSDTKLTLGGMKS